MRISGGRARGIPLRAPKGIRPTSERVRRAVFSSLGVRVEGAEVLDLYCGAGSYGLEALSRGAAQASFVDIDERVLSAARANADRAGLGEHASFHRRDAAAFVRRGGSFDLVFVDPPYSDSGAMLRVLRGLSAALDQGGIALVEVRSSADEPPETPNLILEDDRRYGDTRVLMYIHHLNR